MTILVTGGAGYIGSHTVLALLENDHDVIVVDNLSNSSAEALARVSKITHKSIVFYQGDILDGSFLAKIFKENSIDSVIHFAGLKSVSESIEDPIRYYQNNISGSLTLLEVMLSAGVNKLIFSSSATVYGDPEFIPLTEEARIGGTTAPYGTSKVMVEQMLKDLSIANPDFSIAALRYFNPVGAHPSGLIGEDPNGKPNNLLPFLTQVAVGKRAKLSVYGDDYPTNDGSGVRDYIHVMDLAEGHISALNRLSKGFKAYNLGSGVGYSVLQIISAFERFSGQKIPYEIVNRRVGDIAECWANSDLALDELGWKTKRNLTDILEDAWRWQKLNPNGYKK
ncbi:TPA: UDP-glucose 4-epimerase GalE [Yersinia enterocolitica]|uniref:UDP-glucose 4-epimerase GalE n=1 Tax=Yersinia enterocolitica TaxID=630 RepID=UPI0021E6F17B|nr:UDP-glucose 4-epimerase GalE [Yersinia enterocolitica]UYJ86273.1 UDP-glucose 4-epimerase GalE [Yersinia enterocolitica]UYK16105.1 UDP-glucose 4-epimerase GalE [Yersinia enterocolitica]HDL7929326.1 UDP-glucose 4-epimerase GalE [Yersinia enterocolitica]HDL7933687.1 UDP-glucose 4-epimerase GalE [Yersinia enterocolitica]HDY4895805.1 UDP-glucose 4-epimerase GalE [Yersinia enterocolitica]